MHLYFYNGYFVHYNWHLTKWQRFIVDLYLLAYTTPIKQGYCWCIVSGNASWIRVFSPEGCYRTVLTHTARWKRAIRHQRQEAHNTFGTLKLKSCFQIYTVTFIYTALYTIQIISNSHIMHILNNALLWQSLPALLQWKINQHIEYAAQGRLWAGVTAVVDL